MDFSFNDDHMALREAVKRFCDGEYPVEQRGNAITFAQHTQRRAAMAELGLLGLPFRAEVGGSAQGSVEVMLVSQELGHALGDGAFVASTVMAGTLMTRLTSATQQKQWIPPLTNGHKQMAVAVYEADIRYEWQQTTTECVFSESGWTLNGHKTQVLHGDSADALLVVARTSGAVADRRGLSVFLVDVAAPGVTVQGFDTLDNRRIAHVTFKDVKLDADCLLGTHDGHTTQAAEAIEAALDAATAALCAEAVGAVEALLAHTAEHLRTRQQFGTPLAKFQVIQHRVADMAMALEQLKSMACAAAMAVQANEPRQRRRLVSAAKVLVSQKGREIGLAAIQMHGAMGMTDECRVGHYAKRLLVIGQTLGDAAWHLKRLRNL